MNLMKIWKCCLKNVNLFICKGAAKDDITTQPMDHDTTDLVILYVEFHVFEMKPFLNHTFSMVSGIVIGILMKFNSATTMCRKGQCLDSMNWKIS